MEKKKIILDVDTGHDDAAAIMFAAGSPAIDIVGITVTAGNQTLEKTLLNTLNLCSELHIKTPVFAGLSKPLLREQITAGDIHGETGFDGPVFSPLKKKADRRRAVEFIISAILDEPGEITLVATGPLTNIAAAVRMEPGITGAVKNIVFMGGSLGRGNITPSAEFNIFADPEAADIVFRSGAPLVMVPLDVTTKVALDDPMLNFLRRNDNSAVSIFAASMEHYTRACLSYSGECPAMHDPLCIAWVLAPEMFSTEEYFVQVELKGTLTYGRTVADTAGVLKQKPNMRVAVDVRKERFWELFDGALQNYT